MDEESQRLQLTERMQQARNRYLQLSDEYDGFLKQAHEGEHGTQPVIKALQSANSVGPELSLALKAYLDAVQSLAEFYHQQP